MAAYTSYINSTAYKKLPEDVEDELTRDLLNTSIKEDKTFSKFKERISLEPEQVSQSVISLRDHSILSL